MIRKGTLAVIAMSLLIAALPDALSWATARLPKPGSAERVAALVAAAPSIQRLPVGLVPPLAQVPGDQPKAYWGVAGRECDGLTKCVFGDKASKKVVVLFGDSHAMMWLPALAPVMGAAHVRLVLTWRPGCPAATVSVWDAARRSIAVGCDKWRTASIAQIRSAHPSLVLLSDRTSNIPGAGNKRTTDSAWQAGLERTIAELKPRASHVAVIGDVTALSSQPGPCLAAYPTAIQTCSVPNPNPHGYQHFAAERAAATAQGAMYVDPQPWLCTKTCTLVVGTMATYFDQYHVAATYAGFLSGVFATVLKALLAP